MHKKFKIDLHSHTRFSDGQLTPSELVLRAHTMQVDVLAITDHDTVAGLDEAHACQAGQKRPMQIIDGVEISTRWHGFDIHIVGLNVDRKAPCLTEKLAQQTKTRNERAAKIGEKLAKCGFEGVLEKARSLAGVGQVTRAHFARALVSDYGVANMDAAFKKYLGKGKRASVSAEWPSIEQAIGWIQQAGGQAVLAHPAHYDMTTKWLRRLVAEYASAGGDGIEAVFPGLNPDKQKIIAGLAVEYGLLASAGSDFHFPSRWTELGRNLNLDPALTPIWHNWPLALQH
ncbi:PHP domain-containing protein [Alteromonas aestuariivivens]|uniref:PHP domain-containing protein n=1 Tax=Alteromonas aestuariivivens TaxID=1938339 RepID=A0A3D8M464_9ALTE|nr:PHP domain-containing protein [Alteromonas aestuariivivens]RDV24324.1 PHP domain-containing protein [Alteromonas aestuariivivens]